MPQKRSLDSFKEYKEEVKERHRSGEVVTSIHATREVKKKSEMNRSSWTLLKAFWKFTQPQRGYILFALATLMIATCIRLIPPIGTKIVVDCILLPEEVPTWMTDIAPFASDKITLLITVASAVVFFTLASSGIRITGRWYATKAVQLTQSHLRRLMFAHTSRLPLHRVYELKSGGIASLLRQDVSAVADLIFNLFFNPWRAIIQLIGSLIVLAWVDWRLLVGALILLPVVYYTHRTYISRIRPIYRDIRLKRQKLDGDATEIFGGMRVVRTYNRIRSETTRYVTGTHVMSRQELFAWWWARGIEILWEIILPIASAGIMIYGSWQILYGPLEPGDLMMFMFYLVLLLDPLAVLANSSTAFQSGLSGLDRILDIMDEEKEMVPDSKTVRVSKENSAGTISIEHVSFRYPETEKDVLKNINLEIQAGETVAFVGPSGAGKTTLCNLIARFYDVTEGCIRLDGRDIRDIDVESYRSLLAMVEQDIFLFDGTIGENIGYGNKLATQTDIEEAARSANAHDFILSLDQGYDSVIGERGVKLSGGQRQRIALARAIVADPCILILDEATSNLDTESERLIQQSLAELLATRTSFVIAHRLSTIMHADQIIVIEDGAILEHGTHESLMAKSTRYRDMVLLQIGEPLEM